MRFLFVDRILQSLPDVVRGIKHVTRDDYYLCRDEHNKVCFMPSLIGETLGQLAAWNVMAQNNFTQRPVAGVVSSVSLYRPVHIGETLLLEAHIDALDDVAVRYHGEARVNAEVVFRIESALGPLLPMATFIDPAIVQQQFLEIDRPGPWPYVGRSHHATSEALSLESALTSNSLLFDRIVKCEPGETLCAEKCISRAASYFPDHFPNKPVLPMTVLLECKLNLVNEFLTRASFAEVYKVTEMRKIKMNDFMYPGDVVVSHLNVKHRDSSELILSLRSEVDGKRVCVLEMVLLTKGIK